jgi:NAD(P)-dependent dehydrogenase (short-subunit alcohol dehydrogenase family)
MARTGPVDTGNGTISFEGQTVVVTGAGNGLGRGFALELARRGAQVLVNDNGRDEAGQWFADLVAQEIQAQGGTAIANHDSVSDATGAAGIAESALDHFASIDAVINNAGNNHLSRFEDTDLDLLDDMLWVNLKGHYLLTQRIYAHMAQRGYGRIVFVSSASGLFGREFGVGYATAKAALIGMMNVVALEGESQGVLANTLVPDARRTAILSRTQKRGEVERPAYLNDEPPPRSAVSFVVPLAVYLASKGCASTQGMYSARLGRYARVFIGPGQGWLAEGGPDRSTPPTAEDIAERWEQICDPSVLEFPETGVAEGAAIQSRLEGVHP